MISVFSSVLRSRDTTCQGPYRKKEGAMTRVRRIGVVCYVLLCLAVVSHVSAADLPVSERQKIEALIQQIEHLSDAVFIRNNKTYPAKTAAQFLRGKWEATL